MSNAAEGPDGYGERGASDERAVRCPGQMQQSRQGFLNMTSSPMAGSSAKVSLAASAHTDVTANVSVLKCMSDLPGAVSSPARSSSTPRTRSATVPRTAPPSSPSSPRRLLRPRLQRTQLGELRRPVFDGIVADLFYSADEADCETVERLIRDTGLNPSTSAAASPACSTSSPILVHPRQERGRRQAPGLKIL
jgi:hypothetical protein